MIIIEDGVPVVYCDCCGEKCVEGYEEHAGQELCYDCLKQNIQENLCNI